MIKVSASCMAGHIGNFYWISGVDLARSGFDNTMIECGGRYGFTRFGLAFFVPPQDPDHVDRLCHYLGLT